MSAVVASCTIGVWNDLQVVGEACGAIFRAVVVLLVTAAAAAAIASSLALIQDVNWHTWCWWEFRILLSAGWSPRTAGIAAGVSAVVSAVITITAVAVKAMLAIFLLAGAHFVTRISTGVVHRPSPCGLIK